MLGLQIYKNDRFNVRVQTINGVPYFSLFDVCNILGITNSRKVATRLNSDGVTTSDGVDSLGRKNSFTFINESNLYKVIFQSRKKEAEEFTDWVTGEVLPSIRKEGAYVTEDFVQQAIANPRNIIGLLEKIEADKPKVELAEKFLLADDAISIGNYAKIINRGRNNLFKTLRLMGILDNWNIPYQNYMERGYFKLIETVRNGTIYKTTLITPKGQEWVSKRLEE